MLSGGKRPKEKSRGTVCVVNIACEGGCVYLTSVEEGLPGASVEGNCTDLKLPNGQNSKRFLPLNLRLTGFRSRPLRQLLS